MALFLQGPNAYLMGMKTLTTLLLVTTLSASPAISQDTDDDSLIEKGARLFLKGLMQEMEPAIDSLEGLAEEMEPALRNFATSMGPALRDLLAEVEDWSVYHPPEMLPNGDIILRRKTPKPLDPPQNEIEL